MGCCLGREVNEYATEVDRLVNDVPQKDFRQGRSVEDFDKHKRAKKILQFLCASLCLWKPSGLSLYLSFLMALVCIFQLVYDLFVVCGCPGFDCGFLEKSLEEIQKRNISSGYSRSSFRRTSNTVYTLASIGGLFSYTLLLISLILMKKRRKYGNRAVAPSDSLHNDLSNVQIILAGLSQAILTVLFVSAVALFYYIVRKQPKDSWYFYLMIIGVGTQFIAQWAAIVGCHVFAISSFALGTLAEDTIRRIKQMKINNPPCNRGKSGSDTNDSKKQEEKGSETSLGSRDHTQAEFEGRNHGDQDKIERLPPVDYSSTSTTVGQSLIQNKFDIALRYHEDLCAIVSDTVTAYCPWFVLHWFFYGATCLIGIIYISEELTNSKDLVKLAYINVFLVTHICMFLYPCCCAAYITDTCGGIYSRINRTTSQDWIEGHPFRERAQLAMFTSYAKDRHCVFKIGRLTFTSTLAWFSLLLGSTGILFHFF